MRIETTTSNMIDIFLLTLATCDDYESGRDMLSIAIPSYNIRLILHGFSLELALCGRRTPCQP
eukprot:gene15752-11277_t